MGITYRNPEQLPPAKATHMPGAETAEPSCMVETRETVEAAETPETVRPGEAVEAAAATAETVESRRKDSRSRNPASNRNPANPRYSRRWAPDSHNPEKGCNRAGKLEPVWRWRAESRAARSGAAERHRRSPEPPLAPAGSRRQP
jgi:hypothetical protein